MINRMNWSKSKSRKIKAAALVLLTLGLGACDISDGNGLQSIAIISNAENGGNAEVSQCVIQVAELFGTFDNGTIGSFRSRARWSSSDPDTLAVSNFDIAAPGGGFFIAGALLPKQVTGATPVTITASFAGLTTTQTFIVSPTTLEVAPSHVTLGASTSQQFRLTAITQGESEDIRTDLTAFANWTTDAGGTMNADTGIFLANDAATLGVDTNATMTADTGFCPIATSQSVTVLAQNFDNPPFEAFLVEDDPSTPGVDETTTAINAITIPQGFSQAYRVIARYVGGHRQDVSRQVSVTSANADPNIDSSSVFVALAPDNALQVLANVDGISNLSFALGGDATVSVDNLFSVTTDVNTRIVVPDNANPRMTVTPAGALMLRNTSLFVEARAEFTDGFTRNVTRDVAWTTSNATAVTVSSLSGSEGLVFAFTTARGTATVAASDTTIETTVDANGNNVDTTVAVTASTDISAGETAVEGEAVADDDNDNFTVDVLNVTGRTNPNVGERVQLAALATVNNGTTTFDQDIFNNVAWTSSDPSVIAVSNAVGTRGQIIAVGSSTQSASITARLRDPDIPITSGADFIESAPLVITIN